MKSFILALLPGLEEETGEFFDKVCVSSQGISIDGSTYWLGHSPTGSPVRSRFNIVFLPEHLACHAHDPLCSGYFAQLPFTSSSSI